MKGASDVYGDVTTLMSIVMSMYDIGKAKVMVTKSI